MAGVDLTNQVRALVDLIIMPTQTPAQVAQGELNFQQIRERAVQVQGVLAGNPTAGVLSYEQIREYTKETAPKIPALQQGLEEARGRIVGLETTLDPND